MSQNFEIFTKNEIIHAREQLKSWFISNQRPLPWRETPRPYATWLCEIIMQQTRIEQGTRYWNSFLSKWPNFEALAAANSEEVMKAWQGLGYYSRARNLHKAAQVVAHEWKLEFPKTAKGWQALPGVGPYTAAAIASICFGDPTAAVDGNALRVISRWAGIAEPIDKPAGRKPIEALAQAFLNTKDPGMHNQAVMELGALVCTPKSPSCEACPIHDTCRSRCTIPGQTPPLPVKAGKTKVKQVALTFHVVVSGELVLMRQRPSDGIWGELWEFPSTWEETPQTATLKLQQPPISSTKSLRHLGQMGEAFEHILSHRKLNVYFHIWQAETAFSEENGQWLTWSEAQKLPIPRAIEKNWEELEKSMQSARLS